MRGQSRSASITGGAVWGEIRNPLFFRASLPSTSLRRLSRITGTSSVECAGSQAARILPPVFGEDGLCPFVRQADYRLAQDDPQSDAAVSAAGDDRAFRRAFATALVGPNFLLLEGLKGILSAAGFRVVAAASRVNDLVLGAELQSQPILLVVDAGMICAQRSGTSSSSRSAM